MVMIIFCINDPDHLISKICRSLRFNLRPTVPARFTLNLQFPSDISFITNEDIIIVTIIIVIMFFYHSFVMIFNCNAAQFCPEMVERHQL